MMRKYQRYFKLGLVLGCFVFLAACGQKGDLYLPDGQASIRGQVQHKDG